MHLGPGRGHYIYYLGFAEKFWEQIAYPMGYSIDLRCVCVCPGVLELRSVGAGQTVIKGVSSSLYLCMDSGGRLRGQVLKEIHLKHPKVLLFVCFG